MNFYWKINTATASCSKNNMVGLVEEESLMRAFQRWRKMMKEEKNR